MHSYLTDSRNQGSAGIARDRSFVCVMPAAVWSNPTILVATGHKLWPRRHSVASH
jgi:hypothetical protein